MDDLKLTRDDLLSVLNEMNVVIPRDTKLKVDRIRHRLERTLDAAQRYSTLFGNEITVVNPLDYPTWNKKKDLTNGLYRKMWGGIPREGERKRGTFANICALIIGVGGEWKKGTHIVVLTDEKSTAIVVHVSSVQAVKEKRPLLVLGYAFLVGTKDTSMKQTIKKFLSTEDKYTTIRATRVEQAVLLHLLMQNSKHLSSDFEVPPGLDGRYNLSFFLPTTWLSMNDIGRLNKTTGCTVCGDITRSYCSACKSTQYCSKECQQKHWGEHKFLCRSIASGSWHTITLEPHATAEMSGMCSTWINRYDDFDDETSTQDGESRDKVPVNIHGDKYHVVKLQLPIGGSSHMLLYDREKSFQLYFHPRKNPTAFTELVLQMGTWPKLYRWAQRVSDWERKICVDREPQPVPRW